MTRFSIGEVIDGGMLHPSAAYALWRSTLRERGIHYIQAIQGTTLKIGTQVTLQILWPRSTLHKGTNEVRDNGLIVRLTSQNFSLLLLGATAQSPYALAGLMETIPFNYIHASIVQIIGEVDKQFPGELAEVLQHVQPSLLVISPGVLSAKLRKSGATPVIALPPMLAAKTSNSLHVQVMQTAQVGTLEISSSDGDWSVHTS